MRLRLHVPGSDRHPHHGVINSSTPLQEGAEGGPVSQESTQSHAPLSLRIGSQLRVGLSDIRQELGVLSR